MDRRKFLLAAAGMAAGYHKQLLAMPALAFPDAQLGISAAARTIVGIGVHELDAGSLAAVRNMGIRHVRHTIYWHHWPEAEYRRSVEAALERASDLDLLLVLHGGGGSNREFIDFAAQIARLAPRASLQLWNEVDGHFPGWERFNLSATAYAEHLREAYGTLKQVAPEVTIVSSGLSNIGESVRRWAAASAPHCDVVALHVYGFPMLPMYIEKAQIARSVTDKPLWCTELGMEKAVVPDGWPRGWEELQSDTIRECLEEAPNAYERTYIHVLQDGIPNGHGLLRPDGSPRPAATWLGGYVG